MPARRRGNVGKTKGSDWGLLAECMEQSLYGPSYNSFDLCGDYKPFIFEGSVRPLQIHSAYQPNEYSSSGTCRTC